MDSETTRTCRDQMPNVHRKLQPGGKLKDLVLCDCRPEATETSCCHIIVHGIHIYIHILQFRFRGHTVLLKRKGLTLYASLLHESGMICDVLD